MKPYHLTPKRAAKRALKEKMAKDFVYVSVSKEDKKLIDQMYKRMRGLCFPRFLYISKHTPKEQRVVFRKINQIIKFLKGKWS